MKQLFNILLILTILLAGKGNSQWQQLNSSFNVDIKALLKLGNGLYAATNNQGIYYSQNSHDNWTQKNSGLTNLKVYSLATNGTMLAAGTYGNGVFISNNNGELWQATGSGISVPYIYSLGFLGNNIVAGTGGGGIFISSNNGQNWQNNGGTTHIVNSIYVTPGYAFLGQGPYAYRSTDFGSTWTTLIGQSNTTIKAFAETNGGNGKSYIFVGTLDGVFVSTNNGMSWQSKLDGNVNALVSNGKNVFAGLENTYGGGAIFYSDETGSTWTKIDGNLSSTITVRALELDNSFIYLGSSDGLVWKRNLSELGISSVKNISEAIPSNYDLSQNYPNPFNPSTTINYQLPNNNFVSLKIYDALGREIETLVSEPQTAGKYSVDWNAKNYSSGIYYYKLSAGDYNITKRMVLVK